MNFKACGGKFSRGVLLIVVWLVTLTAFASGQSSTGQTGTGQSSTTQTGTGGTASQPTQAGGAGRTNQTGDASRGGQSQGTQGNPQATGAQGGTSRGPAVGGMPGATQTSPSGGVGGSQLPGAARVTQGPSSLGLEQAIQLAIENNLATLLARERVREAEGLRTESRAGLLPNVSGTAYQANVTQNLAALGFQPGTFPGITNTFIGPFNNFDARARLVQSIFSLEAIRNYRVGKAGVRVAELRQGLAREQVATFTALTYLEALRSGRDVEAARADLELAETLLQLARDQHTAGVATGVDVTRAETRLAQSRVRLSQSQTSSEQAVLNLQRVVGLPLGSALTLTDPLRFTNDPLPSIETAVQEAGQTRPEVRIAEAQSSLASLETRAVRAELLPSVDFVGDYGVSGITPTNTALPTRRVAVQLNVPVFNGGLTRGRIEAASSRERQAELELGSVRGQVEEDVRLAFSALRTTSEQVTAAQQSVTLAQRELEMARDRFRAGVGDNVEVVAAQAALSNARSAEVSALAQYNAARLNLAAALGRAERFRW
ncbi:MAG TPA: TolC family protein [Pyrinomonadaceae bacterium]|jgi:outer membrane protein TolC|nr:TolC family protein [Pyrinomonadaceae bacterium]